MMSAAMTEEGQASPGTAPCCSFCGKSQKEVEKLIAGPSVYICNECVGLCNDIVARARDEHERPAILTAPDILAALNREVVGQQSAQRALAAAAALHLWQAGRRQADMGASIPSGILLMGPTGSGKTRLVHSLARALGVPLVVLNATSDLTSNERAEHVLSLLENQEPSLSQTSVGIVYVEGVDSLAVERDAGRARDVSHEEAAQSRLAHLMDRGGMSLPLFVTLASRRLSTLDLRGVLFIAGGAFDAWDRRIGGGKNRRRTNDDVPETSVAASSPALPANVSMGDLIAYGFGPMLAAHWTTILTLHPLGEDHLCQLLSHERTALLRPYVDYLASQKIRLEVDDAALQEMACKAAALGLGARGLPAVVDRVLRGALLDAPSTGQAQKCRITVDVVREGRRPEYSIDSSPPPESPDDDEPRGFASG